MTFFTRHIETLWGMRKTQLSSILYSKHLLLHGKNINFDFLHGSKIDLR